MSPVKLGATVLYHSKSLGGLIETTVQRVNSDGTIEVACKPGFWLHPASDLLKWPRASSPSSTVQIPRSTVQTPRSTVQTPPRSAVQTPRSTVQTPRISETPCTPQRDRKRAHTLSAATMAATAPDGPLAAVSEASSGVHAPRISEHPCTQRGDRKRAHTLSAATMTATALAAAPAAASAAEAFSIKAPSTAPVAPGVAEPPEICSSTVLPVEELTVDDTWIDPCRPSMKAQLLEKLRLEHTAIIERMNGPQGGLNMGVWFVKDGSQTLVLKMVTSTRFMGVLPTEAEVFVNLASKRPELMEDDNIAFPIKVFACTGKDRSRRDLIVMRRAEGTCLADVILRKLDNQQHAGVLHDLATFGEFLAGFHAKYGMQHGDCNPANVIFDETTKRFSLIDVADLGNPKIKHDDVEHFSKGIMSFASRHGQSICDAAREHFEMGYARSS